MLVQLDGLTYFSACMFKLLPSLREISKAPKTEEFVEWCKLITLLNGTSMPLLVFLLLY